MASSWFLSFFLLFLKYFRHRINLLSRLYSSRRDREDRGRETVETVSVDANQPANPHAFQTVLHTLFAASGARARVTSVGREEGDINFCRNRRFYASLCARHPRFDGCSFVVRSLNAGAGKERSIFNLRLHAKREERKSTNDALCDTHARIHVHHVYALAMPRPR